MCVCVFVRHLDKLWMIRPILIKLYTNVKSNIYDFKFDNQKDRTIGRGFYKDWRIPKIGFIFIFSEFSL